MATHLEYVFGGKNSSLYDQIIANPSCGIKIIKTISDSVTESDDNDDSCSHYCPGGEILSYFKDSEAENKIKVRALSKTLLKPNEDLYILMPKEVSSITGADLLHFGTVENHYCENFQYVYLVRKSFRLDSLIDRGIRKGQKLYFVHRKENCRHLIVEIPETVVDKSIYLEFQEETVESRKSNEDSEKPEGKYDELSEDSESEFDDIEIISIDNSWTESLHSIKNFEDLEDNTDSSYEEIIFNPERCSSVEEEAHLLSSLVSDMEIKEDFDDEKPGFHSEDMKHHERSEKVPVTKKESFTDELNLEVHYYPVGKIIEVEKEPFGQLTVWAEATTDSLLNPCKLFLVNKQPQLGNLSVHYISDLVGITIKNGKFVYKTVNTTELDIQKVHFDIGTVVYCDQSARKTVLPIAHNPYWVALKPEIPESTFNSIASEDTNDDSQEEVAVNPKKCGKLPATNGNLGNIIIRPKLSTEIKADKGTSNQSAAVEENLENDDDLCKRDPNNSSPMFFYFPSQMKNDSENTSMQNHVVESHLPSPTRVPGSPGFMWDYHCSKIWMQKLKK